MVCACDLLMIENLALGIAGRRVLLAAFSLAQPGHAQAPSAFRAGQQIVVQFEGRYYLGVVEKVARRCRTAPALTTEVDRGQRVRAAVPHHGRMHAPIIFTTEDAQRQHLKIEDAAGASASADAAGRTTRGTAPEVPSPPRSKLKSSRHTTPTGKQWAFPRLLAWSVTPFAESSRPDVG